MSCLAHWCRGAGTDANVYLEICGKGADGKEVWGPRTTLDNSKNNFERAEVRGRPTLGLPHTDRLSCRLVPLQRPSTNVVLVHESIVQVHERL